MRGHTIGRGLRRHWMSVSLALIVGLSEVAILAQAPVDRTDKNEAAQDASEAQHSSRQIPPLAFAWVPIRDRLVAAFYVNLRFIDRYHDTLNAVSTLAVAIFTATLWRTTKGLFDAGERQIRLIEGNAKVQDAVTRESLRIAGINAEAALKAAEAAERQTHAAINSDVPVIYVSPPDLESIDTPVPPSGPYSSVLVQHFPCIYSTFSSIIVKNLGRNIAFVQVIDIGWCIGNYPEIPTYFSTTWTDVIIEAEGEFVFALSSFTISISDDDVTALRNQMTNLRLFCRIEYEDFMGDTWIVMTSWIFDRPDGVGLYHFNRDNQAPKHYNHRTRIWTKPIEETTPRRSPA